jgi:hypothetical protein
MQIELNIKVTLTRRSRHASQEQARRGPLQTGHEPAGDAARHHDPVTQEDRQQASVPRTIAAGVVPDIPLALARLAIHNGNEQASREQFGHLARGFGLERAISAWGQATRELGDDDLTDDDIERLLNDEPQTGDTDNG